MSLLGLDGSARNHHRSPTSIAFFPLKRQRRNVDAGFCPLTAFILSLFFQGVSFRLSKYGLI